MSIILFQVFAIVLRFLSGYYSIYIRNRRCRFEMRCATATRIILSFYGLLPRTITWYYMSCKGICIRHRATKLPNKMRYANGQKRCQMCDIFIKWDGIWCPCCGYRLRTKSRSGRLKQVTLINQVMIPTVSVHWSVPWLKF